MLEPILNISVLAHAQVLEAIQEDKPNFRFMGTDVNCSQIFNYKKTFVEKGSWAFQCVDYVNEQLPSGYELVFSRDLLRHTSMHAVWQFLNNVKASGAKFLLVGARCALGSCPPSCAAPATGQAMTLTAYCNRLTTKRITRCQQVG